VRPCELYHALWFPFGHHASFCRFRHSFLFCVQIYKISLNFSRKTLNFFVSLQAIL
jgi:hypothetical protein